jgi:hypothetical protein
MSLQRGAIHLMAALTLVLVSVLSTPAHAQAKTGCTGMSCRGRDPQAMGCSRDARTLATAYAHRNFRVELRYSPTCNARWARTTYLDKYYEAPVSFGIYAQLGSGQVTRVMRFAPVVWSRMWTGPIRACRAITTLSPFRGCGR